MAEVERTWTYIWGCLATDGCIECTIEVPSRTPLLTVWH